MPSVFENVDIEVTQFLLPLGFKRDPGSWNMTYFCRDNIAYWIAWDNRDRELHLSLYTDFDPVAQRGNANSLRTFKLREDFTESQVRETASLVIGTIEQSLGLPPSHSVG
jgi:hypothetical protein